MSNQAAPIVPGPDAGTPGSELTAEAIDGLLQDFGTWLREAVRTAYAENFPAVTDAGFTWQALAAEFTALRHEVHLQTRNSRTQLEQNAFALQQLGEALKQNATGGDAEEEETRDGLRPLLKALVDVQDALTLGKREALRIRDAIVGQPVAPEVPKPSEPLVPESSKPARKRGWRWWGGGDDSAETAQRLSQLEIALEAERATGLRLRQMLAEREAQAEKTRQWLEALLSGYAMGLQRIERALQQQGLEPIECVGEPFDPECMEVVEVVSGGDQVGTIVLEEIRKGYLWTGRIFRFAQVRVSRA